MTLDGYAAVFDSVTVIDSWEGRFKEKIAPGAMRKSFRETPPVVQFDHGQHPLIGSLPIAHSVSAREDTDPDLAPNGGAHVVATLHDNWLVQPVRDAIESGAISGMSFRFEVIRDEWETAAGRKIKDTAELLAELERSWRENLPENELLTRTLREVKVRELGPVVFPAYQDTSVGVRSETVTIDLARLHDPDQRSLLARAVLLADQVDAGDEHGELPPRPTLADASAGEHRDEPDDAPQGTPPEGGAAEHPSRITPLDVRRWLGAVEWETIETKRREYRHA
jgi:HK97 family phage prohead protease